MLAEFGGEDDLAGVDVVDGDGEHEEPVGRVVSCGWRRSDPALADGCRLGGGCGFGGALDGGDQDLADGQLGGFVVRLGFEAALFKEMKMPTWSPGASRPPTTRCGSSWKETSCRPAGTFTDPAVLSVFRRDQPLGKELLAGDQVDGGDLARWMRPAISARTR